LPLIAPAWMLPLSNPGVPKMNRLVAVGVGVSAGLGTGVGVGVGEGVGVGVGNGWGMGKGVGVGLGAGVAGGLNVACPCPGLTEHPPTINKIKAATKRLGSCLTRVRSIFLPLNTINWRLMPSVSVMPRLQVSGRVRITQPHIRDARPCSRVCGRKGENPEQERTRWRELFSN
jgi:hypothetical protein